MGELTVLQKRAQDMWLTKQTCRDNACKLTLDRCCFFVCSTPSCHVLNLCSLVQARHRQCWWSQQSFFLCMTHWSVMKAHHHAALASLRSYDLHGGSCINTSFLSMDADPCGEVAQVRPKKKKSEDLHESTGSLTATVCVHGGCCAGLVVAEGSWQLVGQDVPPLHPLALVLQAVDPVTEGVTLGVAAQTDTTWTPTTNHEKESPQPQPIFQCTDVQIN